MISEIFMGDRRWSSCYTLSEDKRNSVTITNYFKVVPWFLFFFRVGNVLRVINVEAFHAAHCRMASTIVKTLTINCLHVCNDVAYHYAFMFVIMLSPCLQFRYFIVPCLSNIVIVPYNIDYVRNAIFCPLLSMNYLLFLFLFHLALPPSRWEGLLLPSNKDSCNVRPYLAQKIIRSTITSNTRATFLFRPRVGLFSPTPLFKNILVNRIDTFYPHPIFQSSKMGLFLVWAGIGGFGLGSGGFTRHGTYPGSVRNSSNRATYGCFPLPASGPLIESCGSSSVLWQNGKHRTRGTRDRMVLQEDLRSRMPYPHGTTVTK